MSDVVARWARTAELFSRRLSEVGDDRWDHGSTCSEWSVRALVDHTIGTQAHFGTLLGAMAPSGAWDDVRNAMMAQLRKMDDLGAPVDVPGLGPLTAEQIIEICINDLLIHTWDLARSVGLDAHLPDDLVVACLAWLRSLPEAVLRSGRYADERPVPTDAPVQDQMLAYAGRTP